MSRPESFLSRWSRRKLESPKDGEVSPSQPARGDGETKPSCEEATPISEPTSGAFDPADLPPIESIAADTDIRSFLRSGVPAELTRAALRRAWAADPTVRDFIGIADNQWDFNDPDAMPGFGPLRVAEAAALTTQIAGRADAGSKSIVEPSAAVPQVVPPEPVDKLRQTARPAENVAETEIAGLAADSNNKDVAGEHRGAPAESIVPRYRRSHGGALPQ